MVPSASTEPSAMTATGCRLTALGRRYRQMALAGKL